MSPRVVDEERLQAREAELLDAALSIIEQEGVAGLNMDKLVARVPYSKGTIYNHFRSKEDLLTGLCCQGMRILEDLFSRAGAFSGNTRERMLAQHLAYLLYALLYPNRFLLVISAMSPTLFERTSEQRREEIQALESTLLGTVLKVVDEAIAKGDFTLPPHMERNQVAFANWSISFGSIALLASDMESCKCRRGLMLERELINNVNTMLDGLGWKPLSREMDTAATIQRILTEVFAEEMAQLASRGVKLTITTPEADPGLFRKQG